MPEEFNKCRASGGKMKTISGPNKEYGLEAGEYCHVCIKGGKEYIGEKKKKKEVARRLNV